MKIFTFSVSRDKSKYNIHELNQPEVVYEEAKTRFRAERIVGRLNNEERSKTLKASCSDYIDPSEIKIRLSKAPENQNHKKIKFNGIDIRILQSVSIAKMKAGHGGKMSTIQSFSRKFKINHRTLQTTVCLYERTSQDEINKLISSANI